MSAATSSEAIASARRNPVARITTAAIAVAMKPNRSVRMWRYDPSRFRLRDPARRPGGQDADREQLTTMPASATTSTTRARRPAAARPGGGSRRRRSAGEHEQRHAVGLGAEDLRPPESVGHCAGAGRAASRAAASDSASAAASVSMWAASESRASEEARTPATTSTVMKRGSRPAPLSARRGRRRGRVRVVVRLMGVVNAQRFQPGRVVSSSTGLSASARSGRSFRPCGSAPRPRLLGSSARTRLRSRAGSRIQSPRSSSPSSCPGPQPAWPTNRAPAYGRPRSAPRSPARARPRPRRRPGRRRRILELGQDDDRLRQHRPPDEELLVGLDELSSCETASATVVSDGRFSTTPERALLVVLDDEHDRAPEIRVQNRGPAISSCPRAESMSSVTGRAIAREFLS